MRAVYADEDSEAESVESDEGSSNAPNRRRGLKKKIIQKLRYAQTCRESTHTYIVELKIKAMCICHACGCTALFASPANLAHSLLMLYQSSSCLFPPQGKACGGKARPRAAPKGHWLRL